MSKITAPPHIVPAGPEPAGSLDRLVTLAYNELRRIAHQRLVARGPNASLSTTALVNEAYLKLVSGSRGGWNDHGHFLAVVSVAMRNVLVDRARERFALKREGARQRITLDDVELSIDADPDVVLQLDEALERLAEFEPRLARVVECRFFGGLTEQDTADALGVTVRTVQRDWVKARVLLRRALEP
jgi:RNA polymerase sigma factor (TIGR02999 family)